MSWLQNDNYDPNNLANVAGWLSQYIKGGAAGGMVPPPQNAQPQDATPAPAPTPAPPVTQAAPQDKPQDQAKQSLTDLHLAEHPQYVQPDVPVPSLSVPGASQGDVPKWLTDTPTAPAKAPFAPSDQPQLFQPEPPEHAEVPGRPRGPFDKIPDGEPGADSWGNRHNKLRQALALAAAGIAEFGGRDPWGTNGHPGEGEAVMQPWLQAAQAQRQYDVNLPAMQQQADVSLHEKQAEIAQKNAQANSQFVFDPASGRYVPVKVGVANIGAKAKTDVANIGAENRLDVEKLKIAVEQGQVARLVPMANGGYQAMNKFNQSMGQVEGSVVPSLMQRTSNTVDFKQDENGNWVALPKTTTMRKTAPPGVGTPSPIGAPSGNLPSVAPEGAPAPTPTGTPAPKNNSTAPNPSVAKGGLQARPVLGVDGKPMGSKASNEMVYAFDPKANELVAVSRKEAAANPNLQITSNNVSAKQIMDDRAMSDRLVDVQTKMNRYKSNVTSNDLTEFDQNRMALVLNSDKFKLGAFGLEIPVDELNQYIKQMRIDDLPDAAKKTLISYYNAREALNGYAKVLAGSGQSSDKSLELNLDALPNPVMPKKFISEGIDQFGENVGILARRFPRFKGAPTPMDVQRQQQKDDKEQKPAPQAQPVAAPQNQQQWLQQNHQQSPWLGWNPT